MKRLLFLSCAFEPEFGGMQSLMRSLLGALQKRDDVRVVLTGHRTPVSALRVLLTPGDVLYLGDALLSPMLPLVALFRPSLRRTVTVHGLDVVWNFPGYRAVIGFCLRFAHRIAAVSHATKDACIALGIPADRIIILPCGIDIPAVIDRTRPDVPTLLLLGRLVKRKGRRWFVENVMPRLPGVRLIMGPVSEEKKEELYQSASLLVMPNIAVAGDMEGFGITAIEAAARGLPVVAARLEGLQDSVIEHVTGEFFTPLDAKNAADVIESALKREWNIDMMRSAIREQFDIDLIASRYVHELF